MRFVFDGRIENNTKKKRVPRKSTRSLSRIQTARRKKNVTPIFCTSRYPIMGSIYAVSINEELDFFSSTRIINQNVLFIFRHSESASHCYSRCAVCLGCNVLSNVVSLLQYGIIIRSVYFIL